MPPGKKKASADKSSGRKRRARSSSKPAPKKKKEQTIFPVHSIHQLMEQKLPGGVVKPEAALFLTGVMEYLAAEIMEQSLNVARSRMNTTDMSSVKLTTNDVETALQNDPELKELMDKVRGRPSEGAAP